MTKEFKRTFFSSSIAVLLILTNLIGLKYTSFANFVLPVSFITYPLIALSVIMLVDLYGRNTAKQAVYTAFVLQLFMLLIYLLTTNLANQTTISDMAYEINRVFRIDIVSIITSLIVYLALCYVTINLFDNFKLKNQKSIGSVICLFLFTVLYGSIYILVTNYGEGYQILLKLLYTHLVSAFFMTMICYGLYYVLRENFDYSEPEMVSTKDKSLKTLLEEEKIVVTEEKKETKDYKKKKKNKSNKKDTKVKSNQKKDKK